MSNEHEKSDLVSIARNIVEGRVRPLLGACQLCRYVHTFKNEIEPELWKLIVAVSSECDGLPLGSERQYWAPDVLKEKDKRAEAYEARVGPEIMDAARELLAQFVKCQHL